VETGCEELHHCCSFDGIGMSYLYMSTEKAQEVIKRSVEI